MVKPFLYDAVDMLYNSVMKHMPKYMQERDIANACIFGFFGTLGLTYVLQWTSKNVVDKIIPGFDKIALPKLERLCQVGITIAPVLYATIDPEGAKAIITQHPAYISGMAGAALGGILGAELDQRKRLCNPQSLEKEVEKSVVYPPEEKDL
ncbi:hypothetical protein JW851_02490 [Candidatus Woesearchaeota archaeon]|nr:hypothetical protein [Candidatus Woesearchaeota archaeon]